MNVPLGISETPEGSAIGIRVVPRASRNRIDGVRDGALLVRLTAPPVEGAANDALLILIAEEFRLPRRSVRLLSGERSRQKRVLIAGLSADTVRARLSDILARLKPGATR